MSISIKSKKDIQALRVVNGIVARTLELLRQNIKEGVSLLELDSMASDYIVSCGARPSFYKLYGFPKSICISVNHVIIHGIPSDYILKNGDIVGIDIGAEYRGWYGDAAITAGVGEISDNDNKLIECSKNTLYNAIKSIKTGLYFRELSEILEENITKCGFVPLEGFCGHGIGRSPHEEPEIPNYLKSLDPKQGPKIKEGMVFCIEPMVCQHDGEPIILGDKWSVVARDGLNGSHYEHAVAIVGGKAEILSHT